MLLQAEVKQAIESLCSYLPSELTGTCKAFVEQYGDKLVQLLLKQLDANKICQELGLCKAGIRSHVIPSLRVLTSHTIPILRPIDTLPMQPVTEGTFHAFYNKVNSVISERLHCFETFQSLGAQDLSLNDISSVDLCIECSIVHTFV